MKYSKYCRVLLTILFCSYFILAQRLAFTQNKKQIDSLMSVYRNSDTDTMSIDAFLQVADIYLNTMPDSAKILCEKAILICDEKIQKCKIKNEKITLLKLKANALNIIGLYYDVLGRPEFSMNYYQKTLEILRGVGDKRGVATCISNMGYIYKSLGNIEKAIDCYHNSLKIHEELKDTNGIATAFNNLGTVYIIMEDYEKALKYIEKSLGLYEKIQNKIGVSSMLNNIGFIYDTKGDYKGALSFYLKSLEVQKEIDDRLGVATTNHNIGMTYYNLHEIDKSLEYLLMGLKINEEMSSKQGTLYSLTCIGDIYLGKSQYGKAIEYGERALRLGKELGFPDDIKDPARLLSKSYRKLGDYKKGFEYYDLYISMRDSMNNLDSKKKIMQREARYLFEKKAIADSIEHVKAIQVKDLELSKKSEEAKTQRIIIYTSVAGLILIAFFSVFVVQRLRITRRQKRIIEKQKKIVDEKNVLLNQQNEEIRSQRDEIEAQRDEITSQRDEIATQRDMVTEQKQHIENIHEELTDSIRYAERIQNAVLPSELFIKEKIQNEFFILFKPKDIVSGDFYWATILNKIQVIAVADCTGHGVPGAFMSMLGISFLNEIIARQNIKTAGSVLDELRKSVIHSLQQKGDDGEQKDGMDIALCILNTTTNLLKFAGANNSLYIVSGYPLRLRESEASKFQVSSGSNNLKLETCNLKLHEVKADLSAETRLIEVKADKQPVAIYDQMTPFTTQEIDVKPGDIIYLCSDGFADQFGGPKGKKFLSKNLKQLFVDNCNRSMNEQKEILNNTIENWMNSSGTNYEQTDDITIFGIKI